MVKNRKFHWAWFIISGTVVLLLCMAGFVVYALHKPLPPITYTTQEIPAATAPQSVNLTWPDTNQSAFGAVGYGVLETHGEQIAYPTASIAKVMTAMAVLKQKPLKPGEQGPMITMTQEDIDSYNRFVSQNGSVVPVVLGGQLSEYQALQALLLPSANNIAETLARWSSGSISAFNVYANQYAKDLRLKTFTMNDPSGLAPETAASAEDLVLMGMEALKDPVIAEIVAQKSAVIPMAGTIYNVNLLLGHEGTIGIKTGNNDQNPGAYLFAAKRTVGGHEITYAGTTMNAPNLYTALTSSLPLITSADSGFSNITAVKKGTIGVTYDIPWQGKVTASTATDASFFTWKNAKITIGVDPRALHSPAAKGEASGSVTSTDTASGKAASTPLKLDTSIQNPTLLWRLKHAF